MALSPFNAFYIARKLEYLSESREFVPVFSSSNIKIYPFQIAAAHFALKSPYQKGVILCDESGMGKTHEAMLVIVQKFMQGKGRILIAIPNADLLKQWIVLINKYYDIPVFHIEEITEGENPFDVEGIAIATYDFIATYKEKAKAIHWDVTVFEEATILSSVYHEDSKMPKLLKQVAENSFKILLTGTPIEKNIMDLYGLLYFIDASILESEQDFLYKYLRKPENYPELSQRVSKFAFRTLRSQVKEYAKIPRRIPITYQYKISEEEQILYNKLYAYCTREVKLAFPKMNSYDLSLLLLGILGSSTKAISKTLNNVKCRVENIEIKRDGLDEEIIMLTEMIKLAESIKIDSKAATLMFALENLFNICKKAGAKQKILIFTERVETQKYLYALLKDSYKVSLYGGSFDYTAIAEFKNTSDILISTDNGARGFNLAECSVIIQYDLLYNTLKMEQRINRVHRLGQQNDVIVLSFINQNNFADVRKLELVNKRMLVADEILGVSDYVISGFTEELKGTLAQIFKNTRNKKQIEAEHQSSLEVNISENQEKVAIAEEQLFTTFNKEIRDKLKITPDYIEEKSNLANTELWELCTYFFNEYNSTSGDCFFVLDEEERTITATNYEALPTLFYYWSGNQNKKYRSLKKYGMSKDYNRNKLSLTSVLGRGIIHEIECSARGVLKVDCDIHCQIALYSIEFSDGTSRPLLVGKTADHLILSETECERILSLQVVSFTEAGRRTPAWLKTSSSYDKIDTLVDIDALLSHKQERLTEAQQDEVERLNLANTIAKSSMEHDLMQLKSELARLNKDNAASSRMELLKLERLKNAKVLEIKKMMESQFFEQMQLDIETENKINAFLGKEKLTAKVVRQFVVEVENVV